MSQEYAIERLRNALQMHNEHRTTMQSLASSVSDFLRDYATLRQQAARVDEENPFGGREKEAVQLAAILDGMTEGSYMLETLYEYDQGDGDPFVARAADLLREFAALEAALSAQPAAPVGVPDGMVLVPREPTPEMLEATRQHVASTLVNMSIRRTIYRAMLAAAPSAPQGVER